MALAANTLTERKARFLKVVRSFVLKFRNEPESYGNDVLRDRIILSSQTFQGWPSLSSSSRLTSTVIEVGECHC